MIAGIKQDINIIRFNAIRVKKEKKIIIFRSPRKTLYENIRIDSNTYFLEKELNIVGYDYHKFEIGAKDKLVRSKEHIQFALESKYKVKLIAYITKTVLKNKDLRILSEISNDIKEEFNINIDIIRECEKAIVLFKAKSKYYRRLFNKLRPEIIVLVCSYGKEALISAAQDMGISVIEVQHGTMSKYHLGYSFKYNKDIPYFPDKLLTYGDYWKEITHIPLSSEKVISVGAPYLQNQIKKYINTTKIKKSVIFLSQGTIGKRLSHIALEFAKRNPTFEVTYKLHPNEYRVWKRVYPELCMVEKLGNFKIIDSNNVPLYKLLSMSEYQVGINSTVLYEGLMLDLKTILINMPGIEYMKYLIEKKIVMTANTIEELEDCIINYNTVSYDKDYFFIDWSKCKNANINLKHLFGDSDKILDK